MSARIRTWGTVSVATAALLMAAAAHSPGTGAAPKGPAFAPRMPVDALLTASAARDTQLAVSKKGLCRAPGGGRVCLISHPGSATWTVPMTPGRKSVRQPVALDGRLALTMRANGHITDVSVANSRGETLGGRLSADGRTWRSTWAVPAGFRYRATVRTETPSGGSAVATLTFRTSAPQGRRLTAEFGPEAGTYGVGQPVTATLSRPVPAKNAEARARIERALRVSSSPAVEGAWHWVDDQNLHYRPRTFWPAHAEITVRSALAGVNIGDGLYGAGSKPLTIRTGDRIEAITDASAHTMTVLRNGEEIRTIPVTTGKPGYRTRNGIKTVLAKERQVRMRGEGIGIARGSSDYFDLRVNYATRVTWSGEYVHAAPWSVGSHGVANVSHGCTGMSTSNAAWFFDLVRPGDIVQVINSEGEDMTPFDNGVGDWNLSWKKWRKGSTVLATNRIPASPRLSPIA
ncbi:L,D-transpeptidase [Streptomyces indicus]|uniref:Lipoprotein-anchoring transpeptidase ErfK/SrfK n=1 Tax=Streptomyces indicus TaxID=417292 RepID=A0A1G8V8T3_9ACTN|nr:Ig-like domain-containing protein [Streptomyces indicus]SDJ62498.1 Lipoprotein-anchoring transpeptidase ErfK/SrfK [Streptomyces indicus]